MKCVLRVGSSQRSPRIMRAWGRMRNFIISKNMRVKGLNVCIQNMSTYTHPQAMINAIFMQHFASLRLHH